MKALTPYLNFPGTTEEAFAFYAEVLGGEILGVARYRDFGESMGEVPDEDLDKVANTGLQLPNGAMMMATDALESMGQSLVKGNDFSLHVEADDAEDARRIFGALSEGGSVGMELAPTSWAELYGDCTDRFGTQWMVSYTGSVVFGA